MNKLAITLSLIVLSASVSLSAQYKTEALKDNIKTIQTTIVGGSVYALPIIELSGSEQINISFDELSHQAHNYSYMVEHCDADWTPSSISPMEWADGFTTNIAISDNQLSVNTTQSYTHYALKLPNSDLRFKVSGNYAVTIYEDDNSDNKLAVACFSVVESKVGVEATIRSNTDIDLNGKMQQLDFSVITGGYKIDNPVSELKVVVRQNGRIDNQVTDLEPTYLAQNKLSYINNKALIFEGGTEYHTLDISSIYAYGEAVDKIRFFSPYYHAELLPDKINPRGQYDYRKEANGKFVVNIQEQDADSIWADYILVHFTIPTEYPFFDGSIYIIGGFNYNELNQTVRMAYNTKLNAYEQIVLLKQGGYNYLYGFVPKGGKTASTKPIEGSFWQTENEYAIYVYQRAFGERYDKLIAVRTLQSGK